MATKLTPEEEAAFQKWYGGVAKQLNTPKRTLDPNPDSPEHYYDYRAFYRDMNAGKDIAPPTKPGGHWVSDYKLPGNPRTYLNDPLTGKMFNTQEGQYVAGGQVPQGNMDASEKSPPMPGIDATKADLLKKLSGLPRIR